MRRAHPVASPPASPPPSRGEVATPHASSRHALATDATSPASSARSAPSSPASQHDHDPTLSLDSALTLTDILTDPALSDVSDVSSSSSSSPSSSSSSSAADHGAEVGPDVPMADADGRFDSWAAVVMGLQNLDEHGNVVAPASAAAAHPPPPSLPPPAAPLAAAVPRAPPSAPLVRMPEPWSPAAHPSPASASSTFTLSPVPHPLAHARRPRAAREVREVRETRLMDLPNEILDNVMRYLSSRPRGPAPLWDSSPDGSPLDAVHATSFALTCTRACALFRARLVAIRTRPERYREDLLYSTPTAGAIVDVRSPADVAHLAAVLRLAGPALQELLITKSLPRTTWVDAYVACVTNLRKLSLRDVNAAYPLEAMLEASSRTLRELEIVGATGTSLSEEQMASMSMYCSSVHTLALRLSMFDHDWTAVWMCVGPGLKRLSVGATRFWIMDTEEEELLELIGRYCVDLQHLHFYHLGPTLGAAAARLCGRYGDQLKTLELEQSQMLRPAVQTIASLCPNTEVMVSHGSALFSHSYNVDVVDLLGKQITALRYRSQLAHDESLWEVSKNCTMLRELRLDCASALPENALESILRNTAPRLRNLSLSFFVRGLERSLASTAVLLLAEHARELRELHIGGQMFDLEAFHKLALNCCAHLRKVSITFGFRTAGDREVIEPTMLAGVVRALYPCEKLRTLIIVDRTSSPPVASTRQLRQACYPFRARAHRVSICGVDYVR